MKNMQHTKGRGKHGYLKGGQVPNEYRIWATMIQRCYNPRCREYKWYGARGISVCDRWLEAQGFPNFLNDIGTQPRVRASLNRIDNDDNYRPGNVAWSDPKTQSRNRRSNRFLIHNGKSQTVVEWAEEQQIKPATLQQRLYKGMSVERALTLPVEPRRPYSEWVRRKPHPKTPGRKPTQSTSNVSAIAPLGRKRAPAKPKKSLAAAGSQRARRKHQKQKPSNKPR